MITTILPLLQTTSRLLKESTTDTSTLRIGYGNDSIRYLLGLYKWSWSCLSHTLDVDADVQEYDLTTEITDYSVDRGIKEVYVAGSKIVPIAYANRGTVSEGNTQRFYLTPDGKTIGFIKTIDGTEDIDIWAYREHTDVAASGTTLNIPLPDNMRLPVSLYMKALIHSGKRQRNDATNALLEFKQALDSIIPQEGAAKIKDAPPTVGNIFNYTGFKRTYSV